jgi:hypothetical protein
MSRPRIVLATIVTLLFLAFVVIGGWRLNWWLTKADTDRRVGIDNRNLGTQTAWHDEAINLFNEADLLPEGSPAAPSLRRQACELSGRLVDSYRDNTIQEQEALHC